jgi:hypothetical protein
MKRTSVLSLCLMVVAGCAEVAASEATADQAIATPASAPVVHRVRGATPPARAIVAGAPTGNGIDFHGGPLMTGTPNVYYIWYGNWAGNNATTILTDLATTLGGSHYFAINASYSNTAGQWISGALRYAGATTDAGSRGTSLTDAGVLGVVSDALTSGRLPTDANGIYMVLSAANVTESGGSGAFCTQYCGWHNAAAIGATTIKYSWVGDAHTQCPSACMAQTVGPNGNAGADGMASVITHEIEEAVTDPQLNAWWSNATGGENADRCAWTFGTEYTSGGARANVRLGSRDFLIQQNWVNADGGYCDLARFKPIAADDPIVFDASYYLAEYADLRAAFGTNAAAARNHWLTSGIAEGRHASRQFDSVWYTAMNSDLAAAFGTNHTAALNHFLAQGLPYEGRRGARAFDAAYYRAAWGDLNVAFGADHVSLARHFLAQGLPAEGRAGALEVDATYYVGHYGDLAAAFGSNHLAAIDHFLRQGLPVEGRRASAAFDVGYYLATNADLRAAFGATGYLAAFDHWVRTGRAEGRRGAP